MLAYGNKIKKGNIDILCIKFNQIIKLLNNKYLKVSIQLFYWGMADHLCDNITKC